MFLCTRRLNSSAWVRSYLAEYEERCKKKQHKSTVGSKQYKTMRAEWRMSGYLEGRTVVIRERLKTEKPGYLKSGKQHLLFLLTRVRRSRQKAVLLRLLLWGAGPPKNVSGGLTSLHAFSTPCLSDQLLLCSNADFNCCLLDITVREYKVLDHHTKGRFGMLLNLTLSSSCTFWNIYSSFCDKQHSKVGLVSQPKYVCLCLNRSWIYTTIYERNLHICVVLAALAALWHITYVIVWDRKRLCGFIWCCTFQNRMIRNERFRKIWWQRAIQRCCAIARGCLTEEAQSVMSEVVGLYPAGGADASFMLF